MKKVSRLFVCAVLTAMSAFGQGLLETIRTPDRAVPVVNQTLEGVWLVEIPRPGTQGPGFALLTFHANGTVNASLADTSFTAAHGMWLRVGDRKFLQTHYLFFFGENRLLSAVQKLRINWQLSPDGSTLRGAQELVVMSPTGSVMATITGATPSAKRLELEIPADFQDFQKQP